MPTLISLEIGLPRAPRGSAPRMADGRLRVSLSNDETRTQSKEGARKSTPGGLFQPSKGHDNGIFHATALGVR